MASARALTDLGAPDKQGRHHMGKHDDVPQGQQREQRFGRVLSEKFRHMIIFIHEFGQIKTDTAPPTGTRGGFREDCACRYGPAGYCLCLLLGLFVQQDRIFLVEHTSSPMTHSLTFSMEGIRT
jgi:hypothetical protein